MNKIMVNGMIALTLIVAGCSSTDAQSGMKEQPTVKVTKVEETESAPIDGRVVTAEPEKSNAQVKVSTTATPPKLSETNKKLLRKVNYYEKTDKKKPEMEKTVQSVINKVAKKNKVKVTFDINDQKFRDTLTAAATDIQSLTPEETKAVTEYVKKVDAYENELKNKNIKNLEQRLKMGVALSENDKQALEALTPIEKGQKLEWTSDMSGSGKSQQPKTPQQPQQPQLPPQNPQQPTKDKPDTQVPKTENGYNPIAARDYAYQWWNKRNNAEYSYYSRVSGGCENCWPDCTNFVSQAIKAGGIEERRDGTYWYYSDEKPSYAWGVANSFYKHFKDRAEQVKNWRELSVGDVVNIDFDRDGDIEHSAIVTRVGPFDVYVTQHTTDKKDTPISPWLRAGYDVYGWKMSTANQK